MGKEIDNRQGKNSGADVAERIKYLIQKSGMTQAQFAKRIGTDAANVSRVIKGKSQPSDSFLNKIVVNMGVSKQWLASGDDVPYPRHSARDSHADNGAPVYNIDVTAGSTPLSRMFTDERIIGHVKLPGLDPELPIVRVSGDSMQPRLNPGCYISIRPMNPDSTISWGQIYVVVLPEYRLVKYVRRHSDPSKVILHSENPRYDDMEIDRSEIQGLYLVENVINHDLHT